MTATTANTPSFGKKYGLYIALILMAMIFAIPTPPDLPTAGHRMLGILCFAVVV